MNDNALKKKYRMNIFPKLAIRNKKFS